MAADNKTNIVRDTVRRFVHLETKTLARYILANYGPLFDNDLEKIRRSVRHFRGQSGKHGRDFAADKSLFIDKRIKLPSTWRKVITPYHLDPGTWLVLSDAHVPYHEALPLEAAVEAGQAEQVTGIFLNGDWQDCSSVGFWKREKNDFPAEIEAAIDSLDWLRSQFPKAKIVYKPGNHELRLPSFYAAHAPEAAQTPLACMETLIGFEAREIEFLDYFQPVMAGELPIFHGHEFKRIHLTVNPARGLFNKTHSWAACSHCHRPSMNPARRVDDVVLTTWSFGCLCDLHPDWNPFGNEWVWGFAIINVEKDGNFEVVNRRILPNGKVV